MPQEPPVVIVGAGAAGLAAAAELNRAGRSVVILEARDRIGGRMFTLRDPATDAPIELGAEFIHGKPPEILGPLRQASLAVTEVDGDTWCAQNRRLAPCQFFSQVDRILGKMDDSSPDESFRSFLQRLPDRPHSTAREKAKERATDYVSGFNAADPALVGVHWLVKSMRAEQKIEGHRAFRAKHGYAGLIEIFRQQTKHATLQTKTVVERITWKPGKAELAVRGASGPALMAASRVLITLPLALLKASAGELGSVKFEPALPRQMLSALDKLEMGKVIRVVLRFRDRFWEKIIPAKRKSLARMSFLLSDDEWFPTWWTAMPRKSPIITGWAPFRGAERLSGLDRDVIVQHSLRSLSQILNAKYADLEEQLAAGYLHDWQTDPFSRGAYSYAKVGADGAQNALSAPVENTLFFAGEATDTSGHNGTVHGAIASGRRAAAQILQSLGS